jgi:hypothetical protein
MLFDLFRQFLMLTHSHESLRNNFAITCISVIEQDLFPTQMQVSTMNLKEKIHLVSTKQTFTLKLNDHHLVRSYKSEIRDSS